MLVYDYFFTYCGDTVEPLLSGHSLLNGHMSKSQKYLVYIIKDKTSIEGPPLLSGRGHLRVVPNSVFLIIKTSFKRPASFSNTVFTTIQRQKICLLAFYKHLTNI